MAIRYILEFKYLEATKWLHLAENSYEKYLLLYLIGKALKQEDIQREYFRAWEGQKRVTPFEFFVELPEEALSVRAEDFILGT